MMPIQQIRRRVRAAVVIAGVAALLAACHHSDDDGGAVVQPPVGETPNPPAATDAFVAYVSQLIATQNDTGEPVSIDGVAATTPETTEPQALPAS